MLKTCVLSIGRYIPETYKILSNNKVLFFLFIGPPSVVDEVLLFLEETVRCLSSNSFKCMHVCTSTFKNAIHRVCHSR